MNKAKPNQSVHPKEAILFFGTPLFAVPALKKLIDNKYNLAGVVTAPAKPIGRHHNPVKSPIQVVAQENNIPCQTPDNLKDPAFLDWVLRQKPRVAIIAAYGKILPKKLLQIPSLGFVNIHPSLLPRHRGPTPIVHTILAGDKKMGVTLIKLDAQMDHGPIIAQRSWPTPPLATTKTLTPQLAQEGAALLIDTLPDYLNGKINLRTQNDELATTHHLLKRVDGQIDWRKKASQIERQIRAFDPWPGSFTLSNNKRLKILTADVQKTPELAAKQDNRALRPGQIMMHNGEFLVMTGQKMLRVKKLQIAGQKKLPARDFINGHSQLNGTLLV